MLDFYSRPCNTKTDSMELNSPHIMAYNLAGKEYTVIFDILYSVFIMQDDYAICVIMTLQLHVNRHTQELHCLLMCKTG